MDFLISYTQEKTEKKCVNRSTCELKLSHNNNELTYIGNFDAEYKRYGEKKHIRYEHKLTIYLNTGDIEVTYKLINDGLEPEVIFRNTNKKTKNNFKTLENLCDSGFIRGEKKLNYWGTKYRTVTDRIFNKIHRILVQHIKSPYYKDKQYLVKYELNPLYDMILDFHLDKKGIKGHDSIYTDIQCEYPKKKWLIKNDYKYLPAVLDCYGIKSKYLIGELSKPRTSQINISTLNYYCKLFGENYVEYLKSGSWKNHCYDLPPNKRTHQLTNDSEKKCVLHLFNKNFEDRISVESLVYTLNKLFSIREQLKIYDYDLKFNARTEFELDSLLETWNSYKNYHNRGYKWKYDINDDFINMVEQDIVISDEVFKPKILTTEEDFRFEGLKMKNCMSKQFSNGAIYLFISLQNKKTRINLQYRKGNLIQSYGKANTTTPLIFTNAIEELTNRIKLKSDIVWVKQKYDIIK